MYVRIAPHDERTVTPARLWDGLRRGDPLAAFRGNYTQRDVMQEVRQRLRKFRDLRIQVRNIPGFNIGGGSFDIDFVLRGPELDDARARTARSCASERQAAGRHRRPEHHAPARQAGAARRDRPRAGGRPPGGHRADRHRAPADGGRRRGGLALPRSRRQRGLRRPAPPERGRPRRPAHDLAALRLALLRERVDRARRGAAGRDGAGRRARPPRQRRQDRPGGDRLPHRPLRPPARGPAPRRHRARLRPGRPHRGAPAG